MFEYLRFESFFERLDGGKIAWKIPNFKTSTNPVFMNSYSPGFVQLFYKSQMQNGNPLLLRELQQKKLRHKSFTYFLKTLGAASNNAFYTSLTVVD